MRMRYYLLGENQSTTSDYYYTFANALSSAKLTLAKSGKKYVDIHKVATNGNRLFVRRITGERT